MRVSDLSTEIVVCDEECAKELFKSIEGLQTSGQWEGLCFIDATGRMADVDATARAKSIHVSPRFMDRFYIFASDYGNNRTHLLERFFDRIAPIYSELVDEDRNIANISILLAAINQLRCLGKSDVVLDFGCGIGISQRVADEIDSRLIGFDPCPNMRLIAGKHGLDAWGPAELAQEGVTVQAAFASYVFHLLPGFGLFKLLWSRLQNDGVFVANFHKDEGLQIFDDMVTRLGGTIVDMEWPQIRHHGSYRAVSKQA